MGLNEVRVRDVGCSDLSRWRRFAECRRRVWRPWRDGWHLGRMGLKEAWKVAKIGQSVFSACACPAPDNSILLWFPPPLPVGASPDTGSQQSWL